MCVVAYCNVKLAVCILFVVCDQQSDFFLWYEIRAYRPKRCGNNNKDEDNSPKILNDKYHQASSQKFRQLDFFLSQKFYFIIYVLILSCNLSYKFISCSTFVCFSPDGVVSMLVPSYF